MSSYSSDMHQISTNTYHNFHQRIDNSSSPHAQHLTRELYKFKEMTQGNGSDPRHIADAAHRIERSLRDAERLSGGQQFMSHGDLQTTRKQFEKIYQTARYMR